MEVSTSTNNGYVLSTCVYWYVTVTVTVMHAKQHGHGHGQQFFLNWQYQ